MSHSIPYNSNNSPQVERAKSAHKATNAPGSKSEGVADALLWTFMLLLESVTVQSDTSIIQAKALAKNASGQIKLDNELRSIQWSKVPTKHVKNKTWYSHNVHRHSKWKFWEKSFWTSPCAWNTTKKKHTQKITTNANQILAANAANMQQNKMRSDLENKLSVMQLNAQIGQSGESMTINGETTTSQEASAILDMLKALTSKILLHT